ncbi:MAG TPA: imidazole glycerol phosphate synthase subunit HisH [Gammaproteobacteria bacterium]|nr:imidazole glycerol phosphate synthase subunit HisH [Gammaproteobacteria bacterium]
MKQDPVMIGCCGSNLASLRFAFERLGAEIEVSDDPERLRHATHVVLPGVGAALDAMGRLERLGLTELLPTLTVPVLGICLGMQLLFRRSDEEDATCLGIIDADVERLPGTAELPIPEMGWNQLLFDEATALTRGIEPGAYAYFVHSYAAPPGPYTRAVTEYGQPFSSVVEQGNFYGTQFHPERSSATGARILENFLSI